MSNAMFGIKKKLISYFFVNSRTINTSLPPFNKDLYPHLTLEIEKDGTFELLFNGEESTLNES